MVIDSDLSKRTQQPLLATLSAALAAFERGDAAPGMNQLAAFENKVRAQVAPTEPLLAQQLIDAAQVIINALGGNGGRSDFRGSPRRGLPADRAPQADASEIVLPLQGELTL